jgi:hypothetical protein
MDENNGRGGKVMLTDYRINGIAKYELLLFLIEMGCTDTQFRLLCFWGRHPKSRLSLYTVARALDAMRINLRYEISALVEKGILTEQHNSNGLTTYTLSDSPRIQGYVGELAKLDWSEIINLRKELKEKSEPPALEDGPVTLLLPKEIDFQY